MEYLYNSADNHLDALWLPRDLWQKRISKNFSDAAPQVLETDRGTRWSWEGKVHGPAADGMDNARQLEKSFPGLPLPPGALPPADPVIALQHMDLGSVYAGVFFGDTRKWAIDDPDLKREIYRAYNDFCLEN